MSESAPFLPGLTLHGRFFRCVQRSAWLGFNLVLGRSGLFVEAIIANRGVQFGAHFVR